MKKVSKKYLDGLVNKIISETIEEKAEGLVNKIKTNVNELGGMEDGHPKFGNKNFNDMTAEELDDLLNNYKNDDSEEEHEGNWVHPIGEEDMEEGFDSGEMKRWRKDKDYSNKEFRGMPKGEVDMKNYRDDSVTPSRFVKNKIKDMLDDEGFSEEDFDFDLNEGFDSEDIKDFRKGKDFSSKEFKKFPKHLSHKNLDDDSLSLDKFNKKFPNKDFDTDEEDYDLMFETDGEVCECGGSIYEGECNECGKSYGEVMEDDEVLGSNEDELYDPRETSTETNEGGCRAVREVIKSQNGKMTDLDKKLINDYNCTSLMESMKRRKVKKDVEEGNEFTGELAKAKKEGKKEFEVGGKKYKVKESVKLTESELISLIEKIVTEQTKLKGTGSGEPRGMRSYKKAHDESGKENEDYIQSVAKKMKDYLKDGSKGEYKENPKHFPKGNGQLEKMEAKKYTMSKDGDEFIDDFMRPGIENLNYDEIHPNEEWMESTIEGSSKTGNPDEYANAEATEVNKRINKKRKENKLAKVKKMAYNKSAQPVVSDKTGEEDGDGINIKLESTKKEEKVLNEEFNKINHLMNYNRKTQ